MQITTRCSSLPACCSFSFPRKKTACQFSKIRGLAPLCILFAKHLPHCLLNLNIDSLPNHSSRSWRMESPWNRSETMKIAQIAIRGKSVRCGPTDKRTVADNDNVWHNVSYRTKLREVVLAGWFIAERQINVRVVKIPKYSTLRTWLITESNATSTILKLDVSLIRRSKNLTQYLR